MPVPKGFSLSAGQNLDARQIHSAQADRNHRGPRRPVEQGYRLNPHCGRGLRGLLRRALRFLYTTKGHGHVLFTLLIP